MALEALALGAPVIIRSRLVMGQEELDLEVMAAVVILVGTVKGDQV